MTEIFLMLSTLLVVLPIPHCLGSREELGMCRLQGIIPDRWQSISKQKIFQDAPSEHHSEVWCNVQNPQPL